MGCIFSKKKQQNRVTATVAIGAVTGDVEAAQIISETSRHADDRVQTLKLINDTNNHANQQQINRLNDSQVMFQPISQVQAFMNNQPMVMNRPFLPSSMNMTPGSYATSSLNRNSETLPFKDNFETHQHQAETYQLQNQQNPFLNTNQAVNQLDQEQQQLLEIDDLENFNGLQETTQRLQQNENIFISPQPKYQAAVINQKSDFAKTGIATNNTKDSLLDRFNSNSDLHQQQTQNNQANNNIVITQQQQVSYPVISSNTNQQLTLQDYENQIFGSIIDTKDLTEKSLINNQEEERMLESQFNQVIKESEEEYKKQQNNLLQQEEDTIQKILKESELMAQNQGLYDQPDYLKQLEEQSQIVLSQVHPLKPLTNKSYGVEWASKNQMKAPALATNIKEKSNLNNENNNQEGGTSSLQEFTVKKKKGIQPTGVKTNPKLNTVLTQIKTVQYFEQKKPSNDAKENKMLELGPIDSVMGLNSKPQTALTGNGWITPQQDSKDNMNIGIGFSTINAALQNQSSLNPSPQNNIDLDELKAFLDDGSLSKAPKKQQYNFGGGLFGDSKQEYSQLSGNFLDFN
eukprot:403351128